MQNRQDSLTLMLRGVLGKTAESALPAAPSVPNPAPRPLKTPSFTTRPPSIGKAVADVRPGLSAQVTSRTQSLGTAKAQAPRQTSVTKAVTTPREFRAAAPAVPMPKIAQLLNPAYGTANASTGRTVPGMSVRVTVPGRVSAPVARPVPQSLPQAPEKPVPENPHYEAREAVHAKRLKDARNADLQAWAKAHPEHVVPRKRLSEIIQDQKDFRTWGDRLDAHPYIKSVIEAPYDKLKQVMPASWGGSSSDFSHDFANNIQLQVNRGRRTLRGIYGFLARKLLPSSWGNSMSARANRLSIENDTDNGIRADDEERNKILENYRTGVGDVDESTLARLNYGMNGAVGEYAATAIPAAGAGRALTATGNAATRAGTVAGFRGGQAAGAVARRLGASKATANAATRLGTRIGKETGRAVSAPARYIGSALNGYVEAPYRAGNAAASAIRHPVQSARAVANGARTAARVVAHPVQSAKAVWKWRPISHGLDAYMYGQNAYDVGRGALEGDFGRAAGSAADTGWYTAMRRLNPRFGIPLAIAPAVAQTAYALGTSNPEE